MFNVSYMFDDVIYYIYYIYHCVLYMECLKLKEKKTQHEFIDKDLFVFPL